MKLKNFLSQISHQGEILADFGQARLVKRLDGKPASPPNWFIFEA